jgi:hypothetical protein
VLIAKAYAEAEKGGGVQGRRERNRPHRISTDKKKEVGMHTFIHIFLHILFLY